MDGLSHRFYSQLYAEYSQKTARRQLPSLRDVSNNAILTGMKKNTFVSEPSVDTIEMSQSQKNEDTFSRSEYIAS